VVVIFAGVLVLGDFQNRPQHDDADQHHGHGAV
jgi:hypothetical protein